MAAAARSAALCHLLAKPDATWVARVTCSQRCSLARSGADKAPAKDAARVKEGGPVDPFHDVDRVAVTTKAAVGCGQTDVTTRFRRSRLQPEVGSVARRRRGERRWPGRSRRCAGEAAEGAEAQTPRAVVAAASRRGCEGVRRVPAADRQRTQVAQDRQPLGPYLGLPQVPRCCCSKKSDLARRPSATARRSSLRYYRQSHGKMLLALARRRARELRRSGVRGHMVCLWHNLMSGLRGYAYPLPLWFAEASHALVRAPRVEPVHQHQIRDDEAVADAKQNNWPLKVRRRSITTAPGSRSRRWPAGGRSGGTSATTPIHLQAWSR